MNKHKLFNKKVIVAITGFILATGLHAQPSGWDTSRPGSFIPTEGALSRSCRITTVSPGRIDTVDILRTFYIRTAKLPSGRTEFNFTPEGQFRQVRLAVDEARVSEFTKLLLKCIQHEVKAPDILEQEWSTSHPVK